NPESQVDAKALRLDDQPLPTVNMRIQPWCSSPSDSSTADAPPSTPRTISDVSIPCRRRHLAVVADRENIQLVGIAAHCGHRRRRMRHEILDAPPGGPLQRRGP